METLSHNLTITLHSYIFEQISILLPYIREVSKHLVMDVAFQFHVGFRAVVDTNGLTLREQPFFLHVILLQLQKVNANALQFICYQLTPGLVIYQHRLVLYDALRKAFVCQR